jgi:hypothetical protein
MRIHAKRPSAALVIALLALCTAGQLASSLRAAERRNPVRPRPSSAAPPPTTTATAQQSFQSDLYGYSVDSWTGNLRSTRVGRTGSPGDARPDSRQPVLDLSFSGRLELPDQRTRR